MCSRNQKFPRNLLMQHLLQISKRIVIFYLALHFFSINGARADEKALKHVIFIPQWVPQAQFAGYYVAHKHSLYRKYGIDLTIVPGGPERSPGDFLKNRKADFATLWLSSGIQMRANGVKFVNIGQFVQHSSLMLVAKKNSNRCCC